MLVWVIGGAILFLIDGGFSNLFTYRAAFFLFVGMFPCAFIVGGISYYILRKLVDYYAAKYGYPDSEDAQQAMKSGKRWFALINFGLAAVLLIWSYASFFWVP